MKKLKPVRTREDCHSWLTLEEVQSEVFGAFVGARQHTLKHDFETAAKEMEDDLQPGTVLTRSGAAWWDRGNFLEYMLAGIVWRLEALAKRKGVDLSSLDVAGVLRAPAFAQRGFDDPYFSPLGGEVRTVTEVEIGALPVNEQRQLREALAKASSR